MAWASRRRHRYLEVAQETSYYQENAEEASYYKEIAGKLPTIITNILSYNQGLNLRLNHVLMDYVRDITPFLSNEFHELMCCPMVVKK